MCPTYRDLVVKAYGCTSTSALVTWGSGEIEVGRTMIAKSWSGYDLYAEAPVSQWETPTLRSAAYQDAKNKPTKLEQHNVTIASRNAPM